MKTLAHAIYWKRKPSMELRAWTAADLMSMNPVSIREEATFADAAAFLDARGFSAAPVINVAGRPVGVISRTDLLRGLGRGAAQLDSSKQEWHVAETPIRADAVRDVMTPVVFTVGAADASRRRREVAGPGRPASLRDRRRWRASRSRQRGGCPRRCDDRETGSGRIAWRDGLRNAVAQVPA